MAVVVFAEYGPGLSAAGGAVPAAGLGVPAPIAATRQRDGDDELPLAECAPVGGPNREYGGCRA